MKKIKIGIFGPKGRMGESILEQIKNFSELMDSSSIALFNWYFYKGEKNEYPFHIDDIQIVEKFFETLQSNFLEVFHPILITTRAYKKIT